MKPLIPVGQINYSNVLPVFYPIESMAPEHGFALISAVPAELNRMLHEGEIVAGPISSFSYAQYAEDYYLFRNLSVSSRGPVGSIFLFSKRPIDDLDGRTIALTSTSATSVNLLKILLEQHFKVTPTYITRRPHLEEMLEEADAALLIGDDALNWSLRNSSYNVYDLGAEWYKRTGLPMVFAVWAVRRDFVHQQPEAARKLHQLFLQGKRTGRTNKKQLISEAVKRYGQNADFWRTYFDKLIHDLKGDLVEGAESYFRSAYNQGLLPRPVKAEMWGIEDE